MQENNYARFSLAGVVVIDADWLGKKICGAVSYTHLDVYKRQDWFTGIDASLCCKVQNAAEYA